MTISESNQKKLADLEFMMGKHRGRLAMAVDLLSDAILLSGQQKEVTDLLNDTKQLIQNVLHELKGKK